MTDLSSSDLSSSDLSSFDLLRHGPTAGDAALRLHAESVRDGRDTQRRNWLERGFTRRRFIAGAGMVGVASIGSQYVTTRVAMGAAPQANGNTMIVIFLRGGCDGLRLLVPASSDLGGSQLATLRQSITAPATRSLNGGWAVNAAFDPLMPLWNSGKLAFVPAVSSGDVSRSHFQAQDFWECGGPPTVVRTGWLDRLIGALGPGTTFRALAEGYSEPRSFTGEQSKLVLHGIDNFKFPGWSGVAAKSKAAIASLYRGLDHPLASDVTETLSALNQAEKIAATPKPATGNYGVGGFGDALADLARIIKAGVGLQIATVDIGGFDTHTSEASDLDRVLGALSKALAGFYADLGEAGSKVTVTAMTEFGRRVQSNGGGGTDHGHGSVLLLMGGGINGGKVHGKWPGLSPAALDSGDVAGANHAFDVLGEVVQKRLGAGSLTSVFPGHTYAPLGVANAT